MTNFCNNSCEKKISKIRSQIPSSQWIMDSVTESPKIYTPRSSSPEKRTTTAESIFNTYIDILHSKPDMSEKPSEPVSQKPFDFLDDEEFAFGINLLNNNVACVGDNMTKLVQMAQEPWPDNVKLFQPYEVEQILLPDNASCLAVQAFLKMSNLPFEVEMRWNAEFMSPSGRVPFIKCGAFVVSELEPIVQFAANKGVTLCGKLSTEEKAEMRAYMSLITNVLVNAELYISWIDNDTYNAVTKVRNSSVYPWPLGWLQTRSKRSAVAKRLKALHWHDKTLDQVLSDVEQCCNSLSQRLGDRDFFFGDTPTPLDVLVFGHVRALLSANGSKAALMIKPITTLLLKHTMTMAVATGIQLKPQEEYLINQAFQLTKRCLSPKNTISERSARTMRSKLCLGSSRDSVTYNRDTFGFKPFASKQIIIMSNEEGLTCTLDAEQGSADVSVLNLTTEILDGILDKVDDNSYVGITDVLDSAERDFEVVFPNDGDAKFGSVIFKINEFLDTIEESADSIEHVGDVTESDRESNASATSVKIMVGNGLVEDSDGLVNDKLSTPPLESNSCSGRGTEDLASYKTDSSKGIATTDTDNSDRHSVTFDSNYGVTMSEMFGSELSVESKDSIETLKMPSDDEISVKSLLRILRQRNAAYKHQVEVLDID